MFFADNLLFAGQTFTIKKGPGGRSIKNVKETAAGAFLVCYKKNQAACLIYRVSGLFKPVVPCGLIILDPFQGMPVNILF